MVSFFVSLILKEDISYIAENTNTGDDHEKVRKKDIKNLEAKLCQKIVQMAFLK